MSASSPTAWVIWLVLISFIVVCIGIIIWFAWFDKTLNQAETTPAPYSVW